VHIAVTAMAAKPQFSIIHYPLSINKVKYLYRLYQICVFLPIALVMTILTSIETCLGCLLGNGHFWGYWPGRIWSWVLIRAALLPVSVSGKEKLEKGQSYVFVANHQGAFDIFLIYAFLGRNFKWMMKRGILKIPFVGVACKASHQIIVDKSGPSKIKATVKQAEATLQGGMSLMVFPEGARTFTGHMGIFRRGAFMLADELKLPVVPITINGSFNVMPRMRDWHFLNWHPLSLTIHDPIQPQGSGAENIQMQMEKSYQAVMSALTPEFQGYVENPDQ